MGKSLKRRKIQIIIVIYNVEKNLNMILLLEAIIKYMFSMINLLLMVVYI